MFWVEVLTSARNCTNICWSVGSTRLVWNKFLAWNAVFFKTLINHSPLPGANRYLMKYENQLVRAIYATACFSCDRGSKLQQLQGRSGELYHKSWIGDCQRAWNMRWTTIIIRTVKPGRGGTHLRECIAAKFTASSNFAVTSSTTELYFKDGIQPFLFQFLSQTATADRGTRHVI